MSSSKLIIILASSLFLVLIGCKKSQQVEMSDLSGSWIENTLEPSKIQLEILPNGTVYISYQDTATIFNDTGSVTIIGNTALEFQLNWGNKTGQLDLDPKSLGINEFESEIYPTTTSFIPN